MKGMLPACRIDDDISHAGLRMLLREEGPTFQRLKTWKASTDPKYAEKGPVRALVRDRLPRGDPGRRRPQVVFCVTEFGPLKLHPGPGGSGPRSAAGAKSKDASRGPPETAPPIPVPPGCGPSSPPISWARTSCSAASSRTRPGPVPGVLPLPVVALPAGHQDRDHLRQLQPAPEHGQRHSGRHLGRREQRRNRLRPDQ
jgi:hypothetical protein